MKDTLRSRIVLGTQYYRQPTPLASEWEGDLEKVKAMGMECIQLRPQWRWHERREGCYQWDDIDRLMELSEKAGLKVIIKFMLETAPDYIYKKYNGYRIGMNGEKIWPIAHGAFYPGGWLPCFDNPDVMARAKAFVAEGVKRYRDYSHLNLWHAWNEPRSRPMGECGCPSSLASYHQWLKKRFGTVEAMNAFLGKCWGEFEDVDVPRSTADFAEMHLWRHWAADRVAWRVGQVVQTIKSLDPGRHVIAHVGMPSVLQDVLNDTSDDVKTRQRVDMYGSSFEMRYTNGPLKMSWPFLLCDWIRSVSGDGYYWINELYPSRGRWEPELSPETVSSWFWTSLACGAKGVILWQYRKERLGLEINDAGLMETDGRDNPVSLRVREVFKTIRQHEAILADGHVPQARIAMVYDFPSDLVSRIEETEHGGTFNLSDPNGEYGYKTALQGAYHLFWMAGIQIDVISSHDLKAIVKYPMVYLPAFFIVDTERANVLREYVRQGGILIAEGGIAQRDMNTWLHTSRPGAGMAEVLGVVEIERVVECKRLPDDKEERSLTLPTGESVVSPYMNASFRTTTAKVLSHYANGSIAMTENRFGKGLAVMTGFSPGIAYLKYPDPAWARWFRDLASRYVNVQAEDSFLETGIYARELQCEKGRVVFLFNFSGQTNGIEITDACTDLISNKVYLKGQVLEVVSGQTAVLMFGPEYSSEKHCICMPYRSGNKYGKVVNKRGVRV